MRSWIFIGFSLIIPFSAHSQSTLKGKTVDARSGAPIPFVTVTLLHTHHGTTSDILGEFSLTLKLPDTVSVSSIGYKSQRLVVTDVSRKLMVKLEEQVSELQEVTISPGDNPAHRIIRKTTANRDRNNPEHLQSFRYRAYHKFYAMLDGVALPDSTRKKSTVLDSAYFFLNESITEKQFIAPNLSKETVIGNRMTGVKDPFFVVLATDFQPFTFYNDYITLLDRHYRNPVSPGSLTRYDFTLTDTVFQGADTVYIIKFDPLPGKNFDALKGQLHINSNGYALENVLAEPADPHAMVHLAIQQHYVFVSGHWFPKQLNTDFILTQYKIGNRSLQYRHGTFIRDPEINPTLNRKDFSFINTEFAKDANKKDSLFWVHERTTGLSRKEENTYRVYDTLSVRNKAILNNMFTVTESLMVGKFRVGKFYLPIEHLLRFNEYEGARIGLGIQTGERISKLFTWEAYAAYGFRDKGFKYGGSWQVNLQRSREVYLKFLYQQDVSEPGNPSFLATPFLAGGGQGFRNWLTSRMDSMQQSRVQFHIRPLRFTQVTLFAQHKKYNPAYAYLYTDPSSAEERHDFQVTEVGLQVRVAWRESYAQVGSGKVVTSFAFPQINFSLSKGITAVNGQYDFVKADVRVDHQRVTRGFGKTTVQFDAGILYNPVPYPLLANGKGAKTGDEFLNSLFAPNQFQTMGLYEFASDRYAYLFLRHNVGRLTSTKNNVFRPELEFVHNMAIGQLKHPEQHSLTFNTLQKGFLESGVMVSNLVRFNYVNIGHYGIGGGVFYRYGPYRLAEPIDNFLAKLILSFSF